MNNASLRESCRARRITVEFAQGPLSLKRTSPSPYEIEKRIDSIMRCLEKHAECPAVTLTHNLMYNRPCSRRTFMISARSTSWVPCLFLFGLASGASRGNHPRPVHVTLEQSHRSLFDPLQIRSLQRRMEAQDRANVLVYESVEKNER